VDSSLHPHEKFELSNLRHSVVTSERPDEANRWTVILSIITKTACNFSLRHIGPECQIPHRVEECVRRLDVTEGRVQRQTETDCVVETRFKTHWPGKNHIPVKTKSPRFRDDPHLSSTWTLSQTPQPQEPWSRYDTRLINWFQTCFSTI